MAEPILIAFSSMPSRNALIFNDRIRRMVSGVFHVYQKYGDEIRSPESEFGAGRGIGGSVAGNSKSAAF